MKPGWIIGFVMAFVIMTMIATICESSVIGPGDMTKLQQLMQPNFPDYKIPIIGPFIGFISVAWDYIKILWGMFWWDYPYFEGAWGIARFVFFIPVSIGMVVTLVLATIRGVSSG